MKKIWIIVVLAMVFTLTACARGDDGDEAVTVEMGASVKHLPKADASVDELKCGMALPDFFHTIGNITPLMEGVYYFFLDADNKVTVAKTDFERIIDVKTFSHYFTNVTEKEFEAIDRNMTFVDVVELVGPPICQSPFSGISASLFTTSDGTIYTVQWADGTVLSVSKYKNDT